MVVYLSVEESLPAKFGRYQLVEKMAVGGMAEIFRALSLGAHGFEKTVVIKRILPHLARDQQFVRMFIEEAKVMVQLNHPKVVQVLDFGEERGRYYIVMEYIKGIDGLALLRSCARLRCRPTTGIAVHIAAEVLDALDYAHNLTDAAGMPLKIVHRDVSPSNIFISELGEVKLGDFGIAMAMADKSLLGSKALKGKYGYMAPEVVSDGVIDHRADIFTVGIVLAELLMIRRLFYAKGELEVLLQVRDASLQRLDKYGHHVHSELRQILDSALAKDPTTRYQDAGTFRDALHRYLFDHRLMVRNNDVRQFLRRLREKTGEVPVVVVEKAAEELPVEQEPPVVVKPSARERDEATLPYFAAEPKPLAPPPEVSERIQIPSLPDQPAEPNEPQKVFGRKRRITLGPPPKPQPVPTNLPETGESPQLGTDEALAAVPEVEGSGTGSAYDFHTYRSGEMGGRPRIELEEGELVTPMEASKVAATRISSSMAPVPPPDLEGELDIKSLVKVLFDLAVEEETGLLVLVSGEAVKEVYLVDGDPQYVASNLPEELFGQYLVQRGVIAEGELSMVLSVLPRFNGKLGAALVGLKLLRPMQVLRHLTHQVRQKLLNAFTWEQGSFAYYRGKLYEEEAAPLGLDAYEVIGAGVDAIPGEVLSRRVEPLIDAHLCAASTPLVPPEVFRQGGRARQVFDKLKGRYQLGDLLKLFDDEQQRESFLRTAYLLFETGMVTEQADE
jgi:serine/threonine-protein kinase